MSRRVKDFVEISEYTSLDDLIKFLKIIRDNVPGDGEPELRIRGDEVFGHRLTISFLRDLTSEEASIESRYTGEAMPEPDDSIERLRAKLDEIPFPHSAGRRR